MSSPAHQINVPHVQIQGQEDRLEAMERVKGVYGRLPLEKQGMYHTLLKAFGN
jgi:hypothetical protein